MRRAYRSVERDLEGKLSRLLRKMREAEARGEVLDEAWFTRETRYRELLAQVRKSFDELGEKAEPIIVSGQKAQAKIASDTAEALARAALGPVPKSVSEPTWNTLNSDALEAFAGLMGDGSPIADHFIAIGNETGDAIVEMIRDQISAGIGVGANPRDVARGMRGIFGGSKARAETVARTEMMRAGNEASRQSYLRNSDVVESYERLSACDARTCAPCWALHGTRSPLSQIMPVHPNDRCVMAPVTKSWAQITGDPSLPDTRPSADTGTERFEQLSEKQKKRILGEAGFDLYDKGAPLSTWAIVEQSERWGPTLRRATTDEVSAVTGLRAN